MSVPDIDHFALNADTTTEVLSGQDRIILWVRGAEKNGYQDWERIASLAKSVPREDSGLFSLAAMLVQLRGKMPGFWDRLLRRHRGEEGEGAWVTPTGEAADQIGRKRTDLLLVWAAQADAIVEEPQIRAQWPDCQKCRRLGRNLMLVEGIAPQLSAFEDNQQHHEQERLEALENNFAELSRPEHDPQRQAEKMLAQAKQKGDDRQVMLSLIDLGAVLVRYGEAEQGAQHLEEALRRAQQLEDTTSQYDALGNLGIGYLALGKLPQAIRVFEDVLNYSRSISDRFTEKMMLHQLGIAYSNMMESNRALEYFQPALQMARELGDQRDEAELCWIMAVCYDERGLRDDADRFAQLSVDVYRELNSPQFTVFVEHLRRFRRGEEKLKEAPPPNLHIDERTQTLLGGTFDVGPSGFEQMPVPQRASLLRMAFAATKSLAKYVASGFKTVSREAHARRLEVCQPCEHYTGVRCRLCGCFTAQKAWMPHEHCPLKKWPI